MYNVYYILRWLVQCPRDVDRPWPIGNSVNILKLHSLSVFSTIAIFFVLTLSAFWVDRNLGTYIGTYFILSRGRLLRKQDTTLEIDNLLLNFSEHWIEQCISICSLHDTSFSQTLSLGPFSTQASEAFLSIYNHFQFTSLNFSGQSFVRNKMVRTFQFDTRRFFRWE